MFAGNFAPAGWMFCEGQLLPISENETLFNLIGTTYGGDGATTFNLPDLREAYEPLLARINHSFGHHAILVTAEDSSNRIVFAGKGCDLNVSSEQLLDRLATLETHLPLNLYRTIQAICACRQAAEARRRRAACRTGIRTGSSRRSRG